MSPARARAAASGPRRPRPRADAPGEADTLAFLAELSRALAVSVDLRRTLAEAITRVAAFMRVEAASLFLLDASGEALECRVCVGPVDIAGVRVGLGEGIVGRAVAANEAQVVADAGRDARVWRAVDDATGFVTRSLACAPLATAAGPIGAIEIVNRRDGVPFTDADARLLGLIAAPAALAINNARLAGELVEQQRLRRELDLARQLQASLLPRPRPAPFPVAGVHRPAYETSGDFYDFFDCADGRIGFVVGDVSGKGLDAALLMTRAASLLRWAGKDGLAPAAWLARANEELCRTVSDGRFVCALVGYCDRAAARVRFAGAGFPPVLVRHGGTLVEHAAGGPPLGIVADAAFEEHDVELAGGALYAFSDGAVDVRDAQGRRLGAAGLRTLIARHAAAAPQARLQALLADLERLRLVDDTTLLLVEAPAAAPRVLLDVHVRAQPAELRPLRAAVRRTLDALGVGPDLRERLVLAVDEACANVIRHGYGEAGEGDIGLRILLDGTLLGFELTDAAPGVDPARVRPKPLGECRCGGFGVALIDEVMDDWRIDPLPGGQGNRLMLRKRIGATDDGRKDGA
jgi:sigma-B regulation protein RsbU (phosphoserine phosphatase)